MSIRLILLLTIVGIILITLGLMGLYVDVNRRLIALKKSQRNTNKLVIAQNRRLDVIEQRDREAAEHIYICCDKPGDDVKFGGEGI
jgi:hypothetical protein